MIENVRTMEAVDQYIVDLSEDIQNITNALRKIILDSSLELIEEYKWSMPNYSCNGLVCYLQASKKHVNLGFHKGNELEDKDIHNVLQGTGKTMRHIRIKKMEDIQRDVITPLIEAAVELNKV
jgi:hypothetical protein